jgi:hypothetical protein
MGLHDVKRFSGELALRAGASDLELMEHMDHSNIKTTLNHYCRPKTRNLVNKIVVPIPNQPCPPTPPNQEPESKPNQEPEKLAEVCIAPAFHFNSKKEIIQFYFNEKVRLENSAIVVRTSGGTVLTVLEPEISEDNTTGSENNAG